MRGNHAPNRHPRGERVPQPSYLAKIFAGDIQAIIERLARVRRSRQYTLWAELRARPAVLRIRALRLCRLTTHYANLWYSAHGTTPNGHGRPAHDCHQRLPSRCLHAPRSVPSQRLGHPNPKQAPSLCAPHRLRPPPKSERKRRFGTRFNVNG